MSEYTVPQAAAAVGRNRSSILRAIRSGRISAVRDEASGDWRIAAAELHRIYPPQPEMRAPDAFGGDAPLRINGASNASLGTSIEIAELRARLDAAEAAIRFRDEALADLRRRLDKADERLLLLLTDQRATSAVIPGDIPRNRPPAAEPAPAAAGGSLWRRFLAWRR